MLQQINFYPLLPKPAKYHFTPALGWRLVLGFIGLLILFYLFNLTVYAWQKQKLNSLQQMQQITQQQLLHLNEQYGDNAKNRPLSWQNQQMTQELQNKQAKLTELKQTKLVNEPGYASYLISFAAAITPGVWLQRMHINNATQQIDLIGNAANSSAIMQFIQNLKQQAVFKHKTFNVLRLENASANAAVLTFTLSTHTREEQDANSNTKTS